MVAERVIIEGCAIATVDSVGTEYEQGHIIIDGDAIVSVGAGPAPDANGMPVKRIDGTGKLATPGLVNTHHHLYQWLTRGYAPQGTLFEWLTELYPIWATIDDTMQRAGTRAGLAALALSGCSTSTDHHYLFPKNGGDMLGIEVKAARDLGVRFHPCRGSMDIGKSKGGLPPDEVVEDRDDILAATAEAIDKHHDASFNSMVRVAVAPCSPFSVSRELLVEAAELARTRGVRMHTHLAETDDEEAYCLERMGMRPVDYLESTGWLGDDVWLAHCIHLNEAEITRFGVTGTGVAHCPSSNARLGAGTSPVAALLLAHAPVGLGVDGAASNEAGELAGEMRQALFAARLRGGPAAMTARTALELATRGGARCLGRGAELGSLEAGKLADVALWDLSGIDHAGIADPVTALVFGAARRVDTLLVQGKVVVKGGKLATGNERVIAAELAESSAVLRQRVAALA